MPIELLTKAQEEFVRRAREALQDLQVALAAIGGVLLFGEQANWWLVLGVALTVIGTISVEGPPGEPIVDQHA